MDAERRRVQELQDKQRRQNLRSKIQHSVAKRKAVEQELLETEAERERAARAELSKVAFEDWERRKV